jgi:hypothetical protein
MPELINVDLLVHESVMRELRERWGGRLPTWDEFKKARKVGGVTINKGIAQKAISIPGVPKAYYWVYGVVTPCAMFLVPIISILTYLFGYGNGWVVFGCFFVGYLLYKVTFVGACYGVLDGAERNETLYQRLILNGAFLFGPLPLG